MSITDTVNNLEVEVAEIQDNLGTNPGGAYANTRVRLDILENRINNPLVPSPTVDNPFIIGNDGVTISTGTGLPTESRVDGSLFIRQDGYTVQGLYARRDGYWKQVNTDPFTASGDLNGYYNIQTVIGLQGRSVADISPDDGYLLIWNSSSSQWEPGPNQVPALSGEFGALNINTTGNVSSDTLLLTGNLSTPSAPSSTKAKIYYNSTTNKIEFLLSVGSPIELVAPANAVQGDIAYYNGTSWVSLVASTSGKVLTTNGDGYNPSWETSAAAIDATTSVKGVVMLSGDLQGTANTPEVKDLTITSEVQGSILYFDGTNWVQLSPNTDGYYLKTHGPSANPIWAPITSTGVLYNDAYIPTLNATNIGDAVANLSKQVSGIVTLSVAGNTDVTLNSSQYDSGIIRLTGTLTGNINVILPLLSGRKWEIYNNTNDGYSVTAIGATGTGVYLPQKSKTLVETDYSASNIVYAAGQGQGIEWLLNFSLIGLSGTLDVSVIALPTNFRLVRCEVRTVTSLVGGTVTLAVGTTSGGSTILTVQSIGAASTLIGDLTSQLGSDMLSTRGYEAYYSAATTIWVEVVVTGGPITDGEINLYIAGYMV